jgi:hypothetical protein
MVHTILLPVTGIISSADMDPARFLLLPYATVFWNNLRRTGPESQFFRFIVESFSYLGG